MLKTAPITPALPRRAKTRPFPSFVLGSQKSSTYPGERAGLGRLRVGRVKYRYACGFGHPAASRTAVLSIVYGWIKGE